MDLNLIKTSTYKVLSKISENGDELKEKVAEAMELSIEDLLGKEIKIVILETFQEFLLSKNSKSEEDKVEGVKSEVEDKLITKKPKKDDTEMKKKEDKTGNKTKKKTSSKASSKTTADNTIKSQSPSKSETSTKNSQQIERLKSKKELDGLNEKQSIAKIQGILKELGIEGKPSLEQCKAIKARREFEAELREIDTSNIIEGKRRNRGDISLQGSRGVSNSDTGLHNKSINIKRKLITSDDESDDESESESDESEKGIEIDLRVIGDSESD